MIPWFAALGVCFALSLTDSGRLAFGLLLRIVLFGGAAKALSDGRRGMQNLNGPRERMSVIGLVLLLATVVFGGLVIGGSIMTLMGAA